MKLIYATDILSAWSYAFSPIMDKLYERFQDNLEFEIICGTELPDAQGTLAACKRKMDEQDFKQIENTTKVKFGESFKSKIKTGFKEPILPSAKAVSIVKRISESSAIPFVSALQKAIFYDGISTEDGLKISKLAEQFGVEMDHYEKIFNSEEVEADAVKGIQQLQLEEKTIFPSVWVVVGENEHILAKGYTSYEVLEDRLTHLMSRYGDTIFP